MRDSRPVEISPYEKMSNSREHIVKTYSQDPWNGELESSLDRVKQV
jgi:hypothetical protein